MLWTLRREPRAPAARLVRLCHGGFEPLQRSRAPRRGTASNLREDPSENPTRINDYETRLPQQFETRKDNLRRKLNFQPKNTWDRGRSERADIHRQGELPKEELWKYIQRIKYSKTAQQGLTIIRDMKRQKIQPTAWCYNTLLKTLGHPSKGSSQMDKAFQIVGEMMRSGVSPDVVTYNTLMSNCVKAKQFERTLETFERMRERGLRPDVISYSILAKAHVMAKRPMITIIELIRKMREQDGLTPDVEFFNLVIDAHARKGESESCLKLMNHMREHFNLQPDKFSYSAAIKAAMISMDLETAEKLFEQMEEEEVEQDFVAYGALLTAVSKYGLWERASELDLQMRERGVLQNETTYSPLMMACIKSGQYEKAMQYFTRAVAEGYGESTILLTNKLQMHMELQETELAEQTLLKIKHPDGFAYNMLMRAYASEGSIKKVNKALEEMRLFQLRENQQTYEAIIQGFMKNGFTDHAMHFARAAYQSGLLPLWSRNNFNVVELHGYPAYVALCCIQLVFEMLRTTDRGSLAPLQIVQGRQTHSTVETTKPLPEVVGEWLTENGLTYTTTHKGGCVVISVEAQKEYLERVGDIAKRPEIPRTEPLDAAESDLI